MRTTIFIMSDEKRYLFLIIKNYYNFFICLWYSYRVDHNSSGKSGSPEKSPCGNIVAKRHII